MAGWKNAATCFAIAFAVAEEAFGTVNHFRERGAAARAADLYSGEASFRRARAGFAADAFHWGGWDQGDLLSETCAIAHPDVGLADAVAAKVAAANAVLGRTTASAAEALPDSSQFLPGLTYPWSPRQSQPTYNSPHIIGTS